MRKKLQLASKGTKDKKKYHTQRSHPRMLRISHDSGCIQVPVCIYDIGRKPSKSSDII